MFFKKKGQKQLSFLPQAVVIWGPGGNNSAKISWPLAKEISKHTKVALVELPCSGIPRLTYEADILDRSNHTEAAILEYERKGSSPMSFCHKIEDNLAILPANPYSLPDHPVVHKVSNQETLQNFPGFFLKQARISGYSVIIFDCQGSLVSPMTFFSLQMAQKIVFVVDWPSDIAWSLVNKERLIDTYKIMESSFLAVTTLTSPNYHEDIEKVLKCPVIRIKEMPNLLSTQEQKQVV
jgi:hypothetical protein